jgi:hypothetical protein
VNEANDALCVSWYGAWHYRGGKPRTYIGGLPASATSDMKTIDPTVASTQVTRANSFISFVAAQIDAPSPAAALGTVSFQSGDVWRDTPVFRQYLSAQVHPRLATQRRRLGKWIA